MSDFKTYLIHEFVDDYKEGYLSRRDLILKVLHITGGIASTATILVALGCGGDDTPTTATTGGTVTPTRPAAASPVASPAASPAGSPAASPAASPRAATPVASPGASPAASPVAQGGQSPLSVAANDPAIEASDITFPGNGATIMAYQARPRTASGPLPVVLVCHENRGLTDHIRDVTRRFAKEGYLACAVDLISRQGGTARADPNQIPGFLSNADPAQQVGDFQAAIDFYKGQASLAQADRVGMTGYCLGGGIVWRAATAIPDLKAAVPYYGPPPPAEQVPNIKAAVLGVYSSDPGDGANRGRDELDAALTAANITHEFKIYPGTQHAFNNDTGPRWNREQSLVAWQDTLAWFTRYLRA